MPSDPLPPVSSSAPSPTPPDAATPGLTGQVEAEVITEVAAEEAAEGTDPRKGPLSFLSGSLTSALLAWLFLNLSRRVVAYYAGHPPHYSAQFAQSIATAIKTLIVGMTFLMTFTCAFIALGLMLTFLRSLISARPGPQA